MPDESGRFRPVSIPRVPWHENEAARCFRCGDNSALSKSVMHLEPGLYVVETVWVCADCLPQHEHDLKLTLAFRRYGDAA